MQQAAIEAGWAGEAAERDDLVDRAALHRAAERLAAVTAQAKRVPEIPIADAADHFAAALDYLEQTAQLMQDERYGADPLHNRRAGVVYARAAEEFEYASGAIRRAAGQR